MEDTQQPVCAPASQQVTSKTPATRQKNPKRVAAGKAVAERTRIARESQRKALVEAQSIIAQAKPPADPPAPPPVSVEPPPETAKTFSQQHNGLASSALSFHWRGSTTNATRSKTF